MPAHLHTQQRILSVALVALLPLVLQPGPVCAQDEGSATIRHAAQLLAPEDYPGLNRLVACIVEKEAALQMEQSLFGKDQCRANGVHFDSEFPGG